MRVLILGADNDIGLVLDGIMLRQGRHDVLALATADCRWRNERQTKKALRRADCDLIVDTRIAAAANSGERLTDLDLDRTHWLAKTCQRDSVGYVYLSSSHLFTGSVERLYTEEDYPDNEGQLGELLLWSEAAVRDSCERHLVLRLGPLFSHLGSNVFTKMMGRLEAGGTLALDGQHRGCPVAIAEACRVVAALVDQVSAQAKVWGIYHYCSADVTSCYEFAELLLAAATKYPQFSTAAVELERTKLQRPPINRVLDCNKIRNTFAIKQLPWRESLATTMAHYFDSEPKQEV